MEKISYAKAAEQLPRMTETEVNAKMMEYRLVGSDGEMRSGEKPSSSELRSRRSGKREKVSDLEKASNASRT